MLDLDEYPDGTKEILLALLERKQSYSDDKYGSTMMKRRLLADRCPSLDKEQVRYRAELLADDHHVSISRQMEHNQEMVYYGLHRSGEETAKSISETEDILGEIPEEIGKDDLLELTSEIRELRSNVKGATTQAILKMKVEDLSDRVEQLEEEIGVAEDG